ncbi:MAG TPA: transcriptional regulator [Pirellulaceae bacterium]|nr:transcriptional regulator [Pirellulaceae bacterium]
MSSLPQTTAPTDELPKDVADLAAAIAALPAEHRSRLEPMMFRVVESTRRRRRILNLVQEALSQLRLDMKYLVFDLEATRRERDALRHNQDGDHEV